MMIQTILCAARMKLMRPSTLLRYKIKHQILTMRFLLWMLPLKYWNMEPKQENGTQTFE